MHKSVVSAAAAVISTTQRPSPIACAGVKVVSRLVPRRTQRLSSFFGRPASSLSAPVVFAAPQDDDDDPFAPAKQQHDHLSMTSPREPFEESRRRGASKGFSQNEEPLPEFTRVVTSLKKDHVLRSVHVASLDENGNGVVLLYVRRDKQLYNFTFERTLPGEKIHLRVENVKRNRYDKKEAGRYRLFLETRGAPSHDEVAPPCPHFHEKCGGCAFLHFSYAAQVREKHSLLAARLKEYDFSSPELREVVPSPQTRGFRSRTEFRFFLRKGIHLGLNPVKSPLPIPISTCLRHPDASQRAFERVVVVAREERDARIFDERTGNGWLCGVVLRAAAQHGGGTEHQVMVTLNTTVTAPLETLRRMASAIGKGCSDVVGVTWNATGAGQQAPAPGWRSTYMEQQALLHGRPFLVQSHCGERFEAVPDAFIPPNLFLADTISRCVIELSEVRPTDTVWDAFCGQGFLSVLLAQRCERLVAFDRSEPGLTALRANLQARGLWDERRVNLRLLDLGSPAVLREVFGAFGCAVSTVQSDDDEDEEDDHDVANFSPVVGGDGSIVHGPDVLVVDPGRNGLPKAFRRFLYQLRPRIIVYIGDGRPLLRDVKLLTRRGGYDLAVVAPFDSHPHTARLDVVAQLRLRRGEDCEARSDQSDITGNINSRPSSARQSV
eukprot:TRINITY_DN56105_c0_g1_i1.p1 TRINITY_DN56105_c0_g1~~TRINITY_DN56105_c0_g1_i1.p1  ORF type:complete len:664 (+),score=104.36 TRINITY_DN56105_c0_g1_i1:66-2057(+)